MKTASFLLFTLAANVTALPSKPVGRRNSEDAGVQHVHAPLAPIARGLDTSAPELEERQLGGTVRSSSASATTSRAATPSAIAVKPVAAAIGITVSGAAGVSVNGIVQTTTTTRPTTTTTRPVTTTTTTRPSSTTTTLRTTTTSRTTTTTASAAGATRTINVTGMTYQNAMLAAHNAHRANHSISLLNWNADLARTAQSIASNCVYGHNVTANGGGYGQNIGAGAIGNAAAGLITNLMYNGEINYYPGPYGADDVDLSNFHVWGHYSQLVWVDTTDVGCFTQYCPQGLANTQTGVAPYFTVCNYSPPGNYVGEFSSVAKPGGGATVVIVGS